MKKRILNLFLINQSKPPNFFNKFVETKGNWNKLKVIQIKFQTSFT